MNKIRGNDMIIICMLKLCGDSICQPLEIIFKTYLGNCRFPLETKKANVVPIYKKGNIHQLLSVNHETLSAFDMRLDVFGIFLVSPKLLTKYGMMD